MPLISQVPVSFINNASPLAAGIIIFCATTLGTLTIIAAVAYILMRPISNAGVFASFQNMAQR
jgi:hypothetical protein